MKIPFLLLFSFTLLKVQSQNKDPMATEIVTTDIDHFWQAMHKADASITPSALEEYYLKPGSPGVKAFTPGRIRSSEYLAKVINSHWRYYQSIKPSTDSILTMKAPIRKALVKLKDLYPQAIFPPVYIVIGALNSGGTSSDDGLIIGADMYGLTPTMPREELNEWLNTVIKPASQVPHIVAHELIHFQQNYDGGTLLQASLKEGSADFLAELISGKHINQHVHDFANPKEKELWAEFKERMNDKDYKGWLYGPSVPGRPNDLGYWMGYKIAQAFYNKTADKKEAIRQMLNIKNATDFLKASGYEESVK